MKQKQKVAVFDIDGTIFRSSLIVELTENLIRGGIFPKSSKNLYLKELKNWLDRKGAYEDYINALVKSFGKSLKGLNEKDIKETIKKVLRLYENRVYRYTRDLAKSLKKKGYYLLAISHSPKYIVEGFAKKMGFNKIYGTLLELDKKGKFTGEILYLDLILDKAKILKRAIEKENLTLEGSVGVGDTNSDIGFLKMVDRPICFNPNAGLYKAAKRHKWPVVVERKDMIYRIRSNH